jgi:hypothetical protein
MQLPTEPRRRSGAELEIESTALQQLEWDSAREEVTT